ncbi:glycosyltransferase family 4 protein [Flaviflagellibacter deserti]|uniref:Glycosyltransferase family 4 protein n=1 Tax=Flaviflagellibacter deserti TaxID=2267266 RepID=A0ABV9Z530_9HYPH
MLCIGGEDHALRVPFLLALRERGFQVSAAATADPAPFARAGIDYYPFQFDRFIAPLADLTACKALAKLIADVRPEIVQSFDTKPDLLVPLAAGRIPGVNIVCTINGLAYLYSSRSPKALLLRPIWRALQRIAARSTTVTVFQNVDDQTFFERYGMTGRSAKRLIPGSGVDVDRFDQAVATGPSPEELRHTLGLGGCETIVTVSRMTRQKGIPTLLEAAAEVHRHRPGVRFLLVGPRDSEGPLAVTQNEIDRHKPYVLALGPRSDVPSLLAIADVFALPTEYREGIPRALLEAAAASRPIVTTRMPGCRDVIRDGWNGYLVAPHSPRQLAGRILDLLRDRETAGVMGTRAATLVRSEFSLEVIVERYASLYEELINRSLQKRMKLGVEGLERDLCQDSAPQFGIAHLDITLACRSGARF